MHEVPPLRVIVGASPLYGAMPAVKIFAGDLMDLRIGEMNGSFFISSQSSSILPYLTANIDACFAFKNMLMDVPWNCENETIVVFSLNESGDETIDVSVIPLLVMTLIHII